MDASSDSNVGGPDRRRRAAAHRPPLLALGLVAAIAVLAAASAGFLSSTAHGISTVSAVENIGSSNVTLGYSADSPDSTWTTLGTISLVPGASYALSATVGLKDVAAGVAATGECALSAPNEPFDLEDASLVGAKGTYSGNLALEGLTQLISAQGASISGSASLLCRVTSPGAVGTVVANDARLIAIPVDTVVNNLRTFRCASLAAPPC